MKIKLEGVKILKLSIKVSKKGVKYGIAECIHNDLAYFELYVPEDDLPEMTKKSVKDTTSFELVLDTNYQKQLVVKLATF